MAISCEIVKKTTKHEAFPSSSYLQNISSTLAESPGSFQRTSPTRFLTKSQQQQQQQKHHHPQPHYNHHQSFSMDDPPPAFEDVVTVAPHSAHHSRHNSTISNNSIVFETTQGDSEPLDQSTIPPNLHENTHTRGWKIWLISWAPWTTHEQASSVVRSRAISDPTQSNGRSQQPLKILGLKIFNARFHFLLGLARGLSVLPSVLGMWECFYQAWELFDTSGSRPISSVRSSELFMAGIWCIVSGYLSYAVLDGLMVRWIVTYSTPAAIVRMLSCACLNIAMIQGLYSILSPDHTYLLHVWILISCILTVAYIIQNFVTSNLALEQKSRSVDLYNIAVFAVVPVGIASFLTMLSLLRSLMILRIDLENQEKV